MLNEKQLIISETILNFIKEKENIVSKYELQKYLLKDSFESKEIDVVTSFLEIHYKLIEPFTKIMISHEYEYFRITPEGNKAIKIGIVKYLARKEKENKKSKTPIIISIIALVIAAIQPGIALYNLIWAENKTKNSYYQGENGNNNNDSIISKILSDPIFVEKTKDIFKHDTVFLNELKRNTTDNRTPSP